MNQICTDALTQLSLHSLIHSIVNGEKNKARAEVSWTETLRLLSSLPDRLANFTQGQLPHSLTPTIWIERVFVTGTATTLAQYCGAEELRLLKDVLLRLEKMGYLTRAVDSDGRGFWSTLLQMQLEGVAEGWVKLRAKLRSGLRMKLDRGLLETLQYMVVVRNGLPRGLITSAEKSKPGSEGVAFLSKSSQEMVAATSIVLADFFKPLASEGGSDSDSDSGQDKNIEERVVKTFSNVGLTATSQALIIAWGWTTHLSTTLSSAHLLTCLQNTLDQWSDSTRIARSLVEEELYLTTLIVTLLSALPASSSSEMDEGLTELSRSSTLLNGVSKHLEHSDPLTRRMGMLVAELMSAKTTGEGDKALNFGKGVWNGRGEGREEARVLRGLSDGWGHHSSAVQSIVQGWGKDGLREAIAVLGLLSSETAKMEAGLVGEVEERTVVKKREKIKSTKLPRRVEPPPRSSTTTKPRPLITMIDSDEDDLPKETQSPLKMFSHPQTTSRHSSASSASDSDSSDGSDNSDAPPGSSEAEIQRLATELSGLTPAEAQHHLSSPSSPFPSTVPSKKSAPRTRASIQDLDKDTESHAPTFTKKSPPPVYISQLSSLLKSSDRSSVRTALHHAARLIRLKSSTAHFGQEVRENAVDLTLALVAIHDNFGIKRFEEMRREALKELSMAGGEVTRTVVGVLGEQVFGSQYSAVQRGAMLYAIVGSAVALSGTPTRGEGKGEGEVEMSERADGVVEQVIKNAREVGESKVPAIRRQRNLQIHSQRSQRERGGGLIQPITPHSSPMNALEKREGRESEWPSLAAPVYFFPLLNRFLAYTSHHYSRSSFGAGSGTLFQPETQSLLLDTLTILLPLLPPSPHLLLSATSPLLELLSLLLLPSFLPSFDRKAAEMGMDKVSTLNLLSVLLHAHMKLDGGEALIGDKRSVNGLRKLLRVVQELFSSLQAQPAASAGIARGKEGGLRQKTLSRCATILLLMNELDRLRQEGLRQAFGFTLPSG